MASLFTRKNLEREREKRNKREKVEREEDERQEIFNLFFFDSFEDEGNSAESEGDRELQ